MFGATRLRKKNSLWKLLRYDQRIIKLFAILVVLLHQSNASVYLASFHNIERCNQL